MVDYATDTLTLWRIARCAEVPCDLPGALDLPARVLWQAEVTCDAADRVRRRAALHAANREALRSK